MEKGRKYMGELWTAIQKLWEESGFARLFNFENGGWKNLIMIGIACVLIYLAIKKQFEPLLLLPIAFGMLLVNLPLSGVMDPQQNSAHGGGAQAFQSGHIRSDVSGHDPHTRGNQRRHDRYLRFLAAL